MTSRRRTVRLAVLLPVCALTLALGAALAGTATARTLDGSTLLITYTTATTIQVKLGTGAVVGAGSTIPAGSYTVLVYDPPGTNLNPKTTISGPGVSLSTDLNSTGMGIDNPGTFGPITFQTSATYSIGDGNLGASSFITVSTSATATASTGGGGAASSSASSAGTGSSSSAGSSGSTVKTVGTLSATVSAAGKVTLTYGGRTVKTLKPGRYKIAVADHSKKAGVVIGVGKGATILSGVEAVGTSSHTVTFSYGTWYFASSVHGAKTTFAVSM